MTGERDLLAAEQAFYDENAQDLLVQHPNRYLLIHGPQLVGHFENLEDAVANGIRQFGPGPFLVRRAGEKQIEFSVPALSLGVL